MAFPLDHRPLGELLFDHSPDPKTPDPYRAGFDASWLPRRSYVVDFRFDHRLLAQSRREAASAVAHVWWLA